MKCFILFNIEGASVCTKYKVVSASYQKDDQLLILLLI